MPLTVPRHAFTPAAAGLAAVLLAACAAPSEDPRAGGLAGGIQGIATGGYEKRIAERQQTIASLDTAAGRLKARADGSNTALASLDRRIGERRTVLARSAADLVAIDRSIERLRGQHGGGLVELETMARKRDEIRALMTEADQRLADEAGETEADARVTEAGSARPPNPEIASVKTERTAETGRRLQQINDRIRELKAELRQLSL